MHQIMTRYMCTGDRYSSIFLALVSSGLYGHYIKNWNVLPMLLNFTAQY